MAEKDVIRTDKAPGPFQGAPYNQAIRVGDLVFSAFLGSDRIDRSIIRLNWP